MCQLSVEYMDKYYQMKIEMNVTLILYSIKQAKCKQEVMQLIIPKMTIMFRWIKSILLKYIVWFDAILSKCQLSFCKAFLG